MLNNINIDAKVDLTEQAFMGAVAGQKEIELAKIAATASVVNNVVGLATLAVQAKMAQTEVVSLQLKLQIAKAEEKKAEHEAAKAKYEAEADAQAKAFMAKAKSAKHMNGLAE